MLALRLGRTVAELLQTISAKELNEWRMFNRISPIGDDRGDLQAGIITSTLCNLKRTKDSKVYVPRDFMPFVKKEKRDVALSKKIRANFMALKKAD